MRSEISVPELSLEKPELSQQYSGKKLEAQLINKLVRFLQSVITTLVFYMQEVPSGAP